MSLDLLPSNSRKSLNSFSYFHKDTLTADARNTTSIPADKRWGRREFIALAVGIGIQVPIFLTVVLAPVGLVLGISIQLAAAKGMGIRIALLILAWIIIGAVLVLTYPNFLNPEPPS